MKEYFELNTDLTDDDSFKKMSKEEFEKLSKVHYMDETQAIYHKRNKKLSLRGRIDRYHDSHEDPNRWKVLRGYMVKPHQTIPEEKKDELASVIRKATDERPIQEFLTKNPYFLTRGINPAHHAQICIPKPSLGGKLQPDFLIAGLDSSGFSWFGIELENPKYKMFTKKGEETKQLKHAIRQFDDWRSWLTKNITYARDELGFTQIEGELPCFLFIGRRKNEILDENVLLERRRAVSKRDKHGLFIHHYEWLQDPQPKILKIVD